MKAIRALERAMEKKARENGHDCYHAGRGSTNGVEFSAIQCKNCSLFGVADVKPEWEAIPYICGGVIEVKCSGRSARCRCL